MIYCSHCGTQNRDGSKFCSNCAARLSPPTGLVCPMCSTPNSTENVFCSKCGARLIPLTGVTGSDQRDSAPPIKGLSLPTKPTPSSPSTEDLTENEPISKERIDDWLTKLRESPPVEEEGAPTLPPQMPPAPLQEKESSNGAQRTPVERSAISKEKEDSDKAENQPAPPSSPQDIPAWLKDLGAETRLPGRGVATPTDETSPASSETPAEELPSWLAPFSKEKSGKVEIPDIGSHEEQENFVSPQPQVEEAPIEPARAEEIPAWIAKLKPAEVEISESAQAEEVPLSTPDVRLVEEQTKAPPELPQVEPESPPIELERAEEIPSWIAELKPLDDAFAGTTPEVEQDELAEWLRYKPDLAAPTEFANEPAEIGGPLANLRGVLPLAAAMMQPHPAIIALPDEKKDGAHLFEEILAEQAQTPRVTHRRAYRVFSTMRPIIYLGLAFTVALSLFIPPNLSGVLLGISGTPAAGFYDTIQSLPSNSTVLVSFDYDPSLSGEMDLVSLAILRQLIQRRINIVALSTLETGPLIAQRVLAAATVGMSDYRYGTNFLNLGFLPGHESGLAQFATQGIPTASRDFDQNQVIGQYPIAANIKNIKNVPMMIELSGSEEALKMWVEQFAPRTKVRMAAGTSAAVEPKALTYRDAGQLAALVSGATGAAQYEILSNQQGEAVRRVTAQSAGQIGLIAVIVLGNLVFLFSRMMENR